MNFLEFVASRRITNTPRGDFIADTRTLIKIGKVEAEFKTWSDLETFLLMRRACHGAIRAGRGLWREYRRMRETE